MVDNAPTPNRPQTGVDLTQPRQVRDLLSRHGVWLTKAMGQHLLLDREVLERIVQAADLELGAEVLEIGPGAGALTQLLSRRATHVVTVELDRRFLPVLRETAPNQNVEVIQGDALAIEPRQFFQGRPYSFVANLPYGVATPLLRKLLYAPAPDRPRRMVVMLQREVARRLAAKPGDMSLLAVEAQLMADVEVLFEVGPQSFFPPPEVSSAVVRLSPLAGYRVPPLPNPKRFFQTVAAGFQQKRKQVHNSLGTLGVGRDRIQRALTASQIDPSRRAETLTLQEWSLLSDALWSG